MQRIVVLESPFAGKGNNPVSRWLAARRNKRYALDALFDCLIRGEAVVASHLLYTQVLDDRDPVDRQIGILAGHDFMRVADAVVVYVDLGYSFGMRQGIAHADALGVPVERRSIPRWEGTVFPKESRHAAEARRRLWPDEDVTRSPDRPRR